MLVILSFCVLEASSYWLHESPNNQIQPSSAWSGNEISLDSFHSAMDEGIDEDCCVDRRYWQSRLPSTNGEARLIEAKVGV